ncbi:MAG: GGGtGRT protein [Clostridia bacterium]|nr:GGGtGRT protein [Clostridia bacterium]
MENKITEKLEEYGFKNFQEVKDFCLSNAINVEKIVKQIQPIAFDNAVMAYELGFAIAVKNGDQNPCICAEKIGEALQSFCKNGSVAEQRQIGLGHGRLASRLLNEKTNCFCFLAGHESFASAEGALGIVNYSNKVRKKPLKVILNGLGKDAGYIIARINGFTYVETKFDQKTQTLKITKETVFSNDIKAQVRVYGAFDVNEGVTIMEHEKVDVSITGNSTNPVRFTHPVAGIYKKLCNAKGFEYFSVASGGGTGRTLHPDNVGAGPASYGLTDTMGKMHCDVQFAGSSSVPAHVAMMGFIGMGNNPIVGATVALAVEASQKIQENMKRKRGEK